MALIAFEFGLSLEEIRYLSIEQYYLFCTFGQIKELERRRDMMLACVAAQTKNPGFEIDRVSALVGKLERGDRMDAISVVESQMDATLGNAIDVSSDAALEALGFSRVE